MRQHCPTISDKGALRSLVQAIIRVLLEMIFVLSAHVEADK